MKTLIIALLVLWLVFALLGAVLEGLFWLLVIGVVAFLATAAWGWFSMRGTSR
ncbi:hypothetical protein [Nostocoides sp. F2B08]|uniref:hypothetical protein n=1 Tax=Nostocoides sp. F2B08 TaxID=2653936 RepID=UPI00186AD0DF|nr:hypothetical protein [Tetrasphaera sp. F2B08]